MTEPILLAEQTDLLAPMIVFPGHRITWAGEGILEQSFLFGTDQGYLLESGLDAPLGNSLPVRVVQDQEAINSVAHFFLGDVLHLGVTTRTEVDVHRFSRESGGPPPLRVELGAHRIMPTLDHDFVASAGPSGLIAFRADQSGDYKSRELFDKAEARYYYDTISVGREPQLRKEMLVSACRSEGLVFTTMSDEGTPVFLRAKRIQSKSVDFVGVVSVGNSVSPLAMVALAKDRSLHFIRDPLNSKEMESLQFSYVPGTAYKLLRYRDHLLLMTSKGLCVIRNLVRQYHAGHDLGGYRTVNFVPLEAVDMNIAFDRWLLIVTSDGVVKIDLTTFLPTTKQSPIPDVILQRMRSPYPLGGLAIGNLGEMAVPECREISLQATFLETPV